MEEEQVEYTHQLEEELRQVEKERRSLAKAQLGMYENSTEDNLAKWQVEVKEMKQMVYHFLKGHRLIVNEKGEEIWVEPEDPNSMLLNDYGVDYVMGLLESFVNKNLILSDFEIERVNEICYTLGNQINEDIYNDYERMGLNTDDKRKKYPMLVLKIIFNVEAALRRAVNGGERRTLRQIMTINQNDSPIRYSNMPMVSQPQRHRKLLNPMTWGG